jgi:hypothetical protein
MSRITVHNVFEKLPNILLRVCSLLEHTFKHLQEKLAKSCAEREERLPVPQINRCKISFLNALPTNQKK